MGSNEIKVRVLFLGPAKELTGRNEVVLTLPEGASVATAISKLLREFPKLEDRLNHYRFAINSDYADENTLLKDGDELALIPPVSGGSSETKVFVNVSPEPIDLTSLLDFVASPQAGAIVSFVGTVREFSHGKKVTALTYEAYEPMAKKELMRIAEEMLNRWQLCKVAIVHRTGTLSIGKISVAIFVSAPHRSDAFEAARYAIERIKETVPIWKREHFEDGTSEWVEGKI
ncbi:molybdopterin synthase catalytic subunit [Candidatus Fervidibacteria bacterium JGI MDM2 SSWTFF-3-K9]